MGLIIVINKGRANERHITDASLVSKAVAMQSAVKADLVAIDLKLGGSGEWLVKDLRNEFAREFSDYLAANDLSDCGTYANPLPFGARRGYDSISSIELDFADNYAA